MPCMQPNRAEGHASHVNAKTNFITTFMFTVSCYSFTFPLVRKADIPELLYWPLLFPSCRPPFAVLAFELIVLARSA